MNWKRVALLMTGGFASLLLGANLANAQCSLSYAKPFGGPVDLNAEGLTERPSDIMISGPNCFTTGTTLFVQYGAVMSVPVSFSLGDRGVYWDFSDSTDSLSIDNITITKPLSASGFVTKIEIHINFGTVNRNAYIILKNLRFDVTGTTGTNYQSVPDGSPLNVFIGGDNPTFTSPAFPVGNVKKTIRGKGLVSDVGWGFENGVCPFAAPLCDHANKGGTISALINQATWTFSTNPAWSTDFPFRRLNETIGDGSDPNFIGPTDLVVDVEDIPSGVTVTLPDQMRICGGLDAGSLVPPVIATWTRKSGGPSATGGNLVGIYQTTQAASFLRQATLTVDTTGGPATIGCTSASLHPQISVVVGNPSGNNADGNMTTFLRVVMGPAPNAQFTGDDAQPSAVPRYLNYTGDASQPTREVIGDNGNAIQYFFLNPSRTVLLYPYVTNLMGWHTGIQIANTGNDSTVFGNPGQAGVLDFFFFPTGGTPFSYTAKAGDGRGLDSNGALQPGGDFAATVDTLLAAAGHSGPFDGYVIVVAHFNFGHGGGYVFDGNGALTSVPALVLGGRCSYDVLTGKPTFPACTSARQGDLTRLPERLDQ